MKDFIVTFELTVYSGETKMSSMDTCRIVKSKDIDHAMSKIMCDYEETHGNTRTKVKISNAGEINWLI